MGPEGKPVRFLGREVLAVPGSRSALNRTNAYETVGGVAIRIPDVESALSLKGAAFRLPGPNRARHLQDAVTLFACLDKAQPDISKSMKKNINTLISAMDNAEAWSYADPTTDDAPLERSALFNPLGSLPPSSCLDDLAGVQRRPTQSADMPHFARSSRRPLAARGS